MKMTNTLKTVGLAASLMSVAWHSTGSTLAQELAQRDKVFPRFAEMAYDYYPRVNFGARLEPSQGVIHGAGQDPGSYLAYSSLFPKHQRPMMQMTYVSITAGPERVRQWQTQMEHALKGLKDQSTTLQIGLNMTLGRDDGTGASAKVATGAFDDAIAVFIKALKTLDRPTYVRIGYEFEGEWNGYSEEGYVSAFRRITQRIREADLDEVATVWCAGGGSAGFIDWDKLMAYYPGDDYVDWWGVDIFSPEEIPHPWLAGFYDRAGQHRKPVMVGEATPRYVGATKGWHSCTRWYKPFFEMVRRHPEIKAISYINWDWEYWSNELGFEWHDWEDARLQNDELVRQLYVNELSHPIWLHAPDIEQLQP